MEIKQLEYFCVACEKRSFSQAAECLYTSQPNVSKVIQSLETELGRKLFERTSKGLKITPYGRIVQEYAQIILKSASFINSMVNHLHGKRISIATLPSHTIAGLMAEFYQQWGETYTLEHREGRIEEICDWVSSGIADLGVVCIAKNLVQSFCHVISHKRLTFHPLGEKEALLLVGRKNPLYCVDSIDYSELPSLRFVRATDNFFSVDHHMENVSFDSINTKGFHHAVYTNSPHVFTSMLKNTQLCCLNISLFDFEHGEQDIKALRITGCDPTFLTGYLLPEGAVLGETTEWILSRLRNLL